MESSHKAENYFFRTRFNCPQLQSRCVSCQYSFPSESYLQNHDCKAFQNSGSDFDDQESFSFRFRYQCGTLCGKSWKHNLEKMTSKQNQLRITNFNLITSLLSWKLH